MANQRRPKGSGSGGPTPYQRRNARAQALGYRNYYDYRLHGNGRRPPSDALPPPGERSRLRGHRGRADLLRTVKPGDVLLVPNGLAAVAKDAKGRFARVEIMVLKADGSSETFTIRRADYEQMRRFVEALAKAGAVFTPSPSLDVRRLLRKADQPDVDDVEVADQYLQELDE